MSIIGVHGLLYTPEPDALRAVLRDVFAFPHVDAGDGWLIFRLPPAELGVHPAEGPSFESGARHQLSFMCDDLHTTVQELRQKGVTVKGEPERESYGITVMLELPGGVDVMLYEPRHAMAIDPAASQALPPAVALMTEALNGPAPGLSNFLNHGDPGLLGSLENLGAEEASARPGGRSSVASHVEHLRYGLELMNRWAAGEDPWAEADWAAGWRRQEVTEGDWNDLRGALAAQAHAFLKALKRPRAWDDAAATNALGAIAHLAYHLGAIRQIAPAAAGPRATG